MGVIFQAACHICRVWSDFDKSWGPERARTVVEFDRLAAEPDPVVDPCHFSDGAWRTFLAAHEVHDIAIWNDTWGCMRVERLDDGTVAAVDDDDQVIYNLTNYVEVTEPLWRAHGYTGEDPTLK